MKKLFWMLVAMMVAGGPAVPAVRAQEDAVLLVTPSRYSVMQVAFDVARRYPTVLVSYQGDANKEPVLHVWNGFEWMPLSLADYQSGAFLQTYPARAILLGNDDLLPASLRSINSWCPSTVQMQGLENHVLVNSIGQYLPFTPADWRWFAGRYNLTLTNLKAAEAEAARSESWYDEAGAVKDPPPSIFKYFTRSRRGTAPDWSSSVQPVEALEGETVVAPAP
jgi:hypothetical protein